MDHFLEIIYTEFNFLFDIFGFSLLDKQIYPMNTYVYYFKANSLYLEIRVEKGKNWFIYISKEKNEKNIISLNTLKQYLNGTEDDITMSKQELVLFLKDNLARIIDLFSLENYKNTLKLLDELDDTLVRKRFPGLISD